MSLSVHFKTRDFSAPILMDLKADPLRLDWSAWGGPSNANIRLKGEESGLLEAVRLLRCPVVISDPAGTPVWWGFVEAVMIFLEKTQFRISIDDLFNKVSVRYGFISPDNKLEEMSVTTYAEDIPSQREFGIKEKTLHLDDIDGDFAENFRDTYLRAAAWPKSSLSQRTKGGQLSAHIKCAGWFKTLAWQGYENHEGFYANTGPGPGVFTFGQSTSFQKPSQVFTPGSDGSLKYAYFQLRGVGDPTRDINAQLRDVSGTLLAVSDGVSGSTLSNTAYRWVRFTFTTPFDLSGGTTYMIGVTANTVNSSRYFAIRTDENQGYTNGGGQYYNGTSWVNLPSVTNPGGAPDLLFRALCLRDTGSQIWDIASFGNQFFTRITAPDTGVLTCPFREWGYDCMREIKALMTLGTNRQRKVLSRVSPEMDLEFYEQPDPDVPTVFMDSKGDFYSFRGTALKPYYPPVGQFARYSGTNRMMHPFDKYRIPTSFIENASYWPQSGRSGVNLIK